MNCRTTDTAKLAAGFICSQRQPAPLRGAWCADPWWCRRDGAMGVQGVKGGCRGWVQGWVKGWVQGWVQGYPCARRLHRAPALRPPFAQCLGIQTSTGMKMNKISVKSEAEPCLHSASQPFRPIFSPEKQEEGVVLWPGCGDLPA